MLSPCIKCYQNEVVLSKVFKSCIRIGHERAARVNDSPKIPQNVKGIRLTLKNRNSCSEFIQNELPNGVVDLVNTMTTSHVVRDSDIMQWDAVVQTDTTKCIFIHLTNSVGIQ